MLESLAALARHHVILASASPRRLELLRQIGIRNIHVQPSKFAEDLDKRFCTGVEYALETAKHKALDVAESSCEAFVIAADTVVEVEGEILEKPADAADAKRMLTRLSNRSHQVHTGESPVRLFSRSTTVWFCQLSQEDIDLYVASGDSFGKAGAYGIQGRACAWVERIDGCYNNVVGFPLHDFACQVSALVKERLL